MHKYLITLLPFFSVLGSTAQNPEIEKIIRDLDYKNTFVVAKADTAGLMAWQVFLP